LGSGAWAGQSLSQLLRVTTGITYTVSFRAQSWNTDAQLNVLINGVVAEEIDLTPAFLAYSFEFTAGATTTLTFKTGNRPSVSIDAVAVIDKASTVTNHVGTLDVCPTPACTSFTQTFTLATRAVDANPPPNQRRSFSDTDSSASCNFAEAFGDAVAAGFEASVGFPAVGTVPLDGVLNSVVASGVGGCPHTAMQAATVVLTYKPESTPVDPDQFAAAADAWKQEEGAFPTTIDVCGCGIKIELSATTSGYEESKCTGGFSSSSEKKRNTGKTGKTGKQGTRSEFPKALAMTIGPWDVGPHGTAAAAAAVLVATVATVATVAIVLIKRRIRRRYGYTRVGTTRQHPTSEFAEEVVL
jgi:hypothetical protein